MVARTQALVVFVAMLLVAGVARAGDSKAQPLTGERVFWYDGTHKRTIVMSPDLLAEFGNVGVGARALNITAPMEKVGEPMGVVQLWRVGESATGTTRAISASTARETGGAFSPVFRDEGGGALRALPGGVLVTLRAGWSAEQCKQWFAAKGFDSPQKLPFGNAYVLPTPAGMAALELANQLHESGEVVSASPNWWRQAGTR